MRKGPTPYDEAPSRAFWSRSVARDFDAADLLPSDVRLVDEEDRIVSAGSCFAANVVPYLERAGLTYLRTEEPHPLLNAPPDTFGYSRFSAAYGNIYTVRQMLQLLRRARRAWKPAEAYWEDDGIFLDPFRPGLQFRARSKAEFEALTRCHLDSVRLAFKKATVFVFTLGLTEAWTSAEDGAVYPACPGTIAGTFDPVRHVFHNFTVAETIADLTEVIAELRAINRKLRTILTVSPVPLVATAGGGHVLEATVYSKAVLRAAAGEVARAHENVTYFPAYEIVTGPQAPSDFFQPDRRNVSQAALDAVMAAFLAHADGISDVPVSAVAASPARERLLAQAIAAAECEEEMADPYARRTPEREEPQPAVSRLLSRIRRAVPRRSGT